MLLPQKPVVNELPWIKPYSNPGGRLRPPHRPVPTWFENVLPGMKAEKKLHIPFEDAVRYYFL